MSDEYTSFLETEITKTATGHCPNPNCNAALRPLHCCVCEGCEGCREVAERSAATEAGEQEPLPPLPLNLGDDVQRGRNAAFYIFDAAGNKVGEVYNRGFGRWLVARANAVAKDDVISRSDVLRILHDARASGGFDLRELIAEVEGLVPTASPSTSSAAIRAAAEEIASSYEVHKNRCHSNERYPSPPCDCGAIDEVVSLLSRYFGKREAESNEVNK